MKLLHVTHQYSPAVGGSERYITDLSELLAGRGHNVGVYTSRSVDYQTWANELPARERIEGVEVRRFRSMPRGPLTWKLLQKGIAGYERTASRWYEPLVWFGNGPVCPGLWTSMMRRVAAYDLVHINQLHYAHSWLAARAARARRVPIVCTPHLHTEQPTTWHYAYMRSLLRDCRTIFAVSDHESAFLSGWEPGSDIVLAGNGLNLDHYPAYDRKEARQRFGLSETDFVMLFLGRKTDYKGLEVCLEAFAELRRDEPRVRLLAVGPETGYSRGLWERYSGLDGLVVRGHVSTDEKCAALAASDVLVLPSTGEAFGIVFLEAWRYCKPVIGASIPAVRSLIADGVDGLLVQPGSVGGLAKNLRELLENPAYGRQLGDNGYDKLVEQFTMERIGDVVESACERVVAQGGVTLQATRR